MVAPRFAGVCVCKSLALKPLALYSCGMNLRTKAKETLNDVSTAAEKVVETAGWSTVALVAVAAVAMLALGVGVIALSRSGSHAAA